MDIREFIYQIEQLYFYEYTSSYILDKVKQQKQKLLRLLQNLDNEGYDFLGDSESVIISNIEHLYNSVLNSISFFLEGDYSESRDIIYDTFFAYDNPQRVPLRAKTVSPGGCFFRIRENNTYSLYEREEMFHIPFDKRELTSNQRFSMSGYPCLYLNQSIYGCWEELHRPNIDQCNIVRIKNVKSIKVISLSMPKLDLRTISQNDIYNIVLSLVCSLKVDKPYAPFKPEYIIPQNVLNCLIKRNSRRRAIIYHGIKYTSTIYGSKQCIFNDKSLFENYVFPIQENKKAGLCRGLCDMFEVSDPTTMLINRLSKDAYNVYLPQREIRRTPYEMSEFGLLEDTLKSEPTYSLL